MTSSRATFVRRDIQMPDAEQNSVADLRLVRLID
jgi:hypothetical protein